MAHYISLLNYSHEGLKNLKGLPARLDNIRKVFKDAGGELISYHLTFGQYDAIVLTDLPDDETGAKILLNAALAGNFSSQTFRAFDEGESGRILQSLP